MPHFKWVGFDLILFALHRIVESLWKANTVAPLHSPLAKTIEARCLQLTECFSFFMSTTGRKAAISTLTETVRASPVEGVEVTVTKQRVQPALDNASRQIQSRPYFLWSKPLAIAGRAVYSIWTDWGRVASSLLSRLTPQESKDGRSKGCLGSCRISVLCAPGSESCNWSFRS